jgi:hypothetical protein
LPLQPEKFLMPSSIASAHTDSAHEARLNLAAEVLHRFGEVRFAAQGSSMIPSIYPGDLLTVRSISPDTVRRGEIVLALLGGRFFVHRVMRKWPERDRVVFATRGDSLSQEDPSIDGSQLLGSVVAISRRGKSVKIVARPKPWHRAIRWSVRNSAMFARLLLATHLLRVRLSRHYVEIDGSTRSDQLQEFA